VTPDDFQKKCPRLWHVAPAGAWERIRTHGFQTSEQLIQAADLADDERVNLLTERRPERVELSVNGDRVVLRDQQPMFAVSDLTKILADDLTPSDWVQLLNRRVYLFVDAKKKDQLLDKYVELDGEQELLTISPWRLLQAAGSRLECAEGNTGAVARKTGVKKTRNTFVSLPRFPNKKPGEVTVVDGLLDVSCVVSATLHRPGAAPVPLPVDR
jgi:hypothetical protein